MSELLTLTAGLPSRRLAPGEVLIDEGATSTPTSPGCSGAS